LLEELFHGLCQHITSVQPPWPGTGPVWTDDVVFRYFADACPQGLCHACRTPVGNGELRGLDFIWTEGDPYQRPKAPLKLALESEWAKWQYRRIDKWQVEVLPELGKVLRSRADWGVLVTARQHNPVGALTSLDVAVARSTARPTQGLLLIMTAPPEESKSCVARGILYDNAEAQARHLGPVNC
jgi:hypothetical protein